MRYSTIPYDHLEIPQGSTFVASWYADDAETGEPADWTGWDARMQVRTISGDLIATLDVGGTANGTITLGDDGNITATIPHTDTGQMSPGRGVFDLEFTDPDDNVWRVVSGSVAITPEVTADA